MNTFQVGIIGGTGLDNADFVDNAKKKCVSSSSGQPSDVLREGKVGGVDTVVLARHGPKHDQSPGQVNYRANILALKEAGCTHIIATNACGSLVEAYKPGMLCVPDSFIDRTNNRPATYYDGSSEEFKGVMHMPMSPCYSEVTRKALIDTADDLDYDCKTEGTIVVIEGPRFATKAESKMYAQWGGHIINMTAYPEMILAREQGMCYANLCLITDYDSWKDGEEPVTVELVEKRFKENAEKVEDVLKRAIPRLAVMCWKEEYDKLQVTLKNSIM